MLPPVAPTPASSARGARMRRRRLPAFDAPGAEPADSSAPEITRHPATPPVSGLARRLRLPTSRPPAPTTEVSLFALTAAAGGEARQRPRPPTPTVSHTLPCALSWRESSSARHGSRFRRLLPVRSAVSMLRTAANGSRDSNHTNPGKETPTTSICAGAVVFGDDPVWIAPLHMMIGDRLNPKKEPFYTHAEVVPFTAWKDGELVGRILGDGRSSRIGSTHGTIRRAISAFSTPSTTSRSHARCSRKPKIGFVKRA